MTALPVIHRRPEADCPFCGKAEGDACPACHGVNATAGAEKKRRARAESERAGTERSALRPSTSAQPGESAPTGHAAIPTDARGNL